MKYTKERFKELWEADENGSGNPLVVSRKSHIFRFFNQKFPEIIWQISILFISLGIETNEIN